MRSDEKLIRKDVAKHTIVGFHLCARTQMVYLSPRKKRIVELILADSRSGSSKTTMSPGPSIRTRQKP